MSQQPHFAVPIPAAAVPASALRASVASALGVREPLELVWSSVHPAAGDLIAALVRVPGPSPLELADGSMVALEPGRWVVGALGERRALKGYSGSVPRLLARGQLLSILNLGGVMGEWADSASGLQPPTLIEFQGWISSRGRRLNLRHLAGLLEVCAGGPWPSVPLVVVAGSSMDAGKTAAARALVTGLTTRGERVAVAKVSGVACLRDLKAMEAVGAIRTTSFLSLGYASTVGVGSLAPVGRQLAHQLAAARPDVILFELGDGLLGDYGVATLFDDPGFRQACRALVLCASDPVGAWGGAEWLKARGLTVDVVSGAVTDTAAGRAIVARQVAPAVNALTDPDRLAAAIHERLSREASC